MRSISPRVASAFLIAVFCGCSSQDGGEASSPPGSAVDREASPPSAAPAPGNSGAPTFVPTAPTSPARDATSSVLLYAHTDTTLFQIDPENIAGSIVKIGDFDCIGGRGEGHAMTDVAVSKDGKIYGISGVATYPLTIARSRVHCDTIWPFPASKQFVALAMAPENTLAATEVLIAGNQDGELFQIDALTGATQQVGTLGFDSESGLPWRLSGDIVLLANNGAPIGFATVRTCERKVCDRVDTLVELNVRAIKRGRQSVLKTVRGQVRKGDWCTNRESPSTFGSMFGIAAYNDKVYGFSRRGDVIEIRNEDGSGCLIEGHADGAFAGAGVTTVAPVKAPPAPH